MSIPLLTKHARDIGASPTVAGLIGSLYGFLQVFSSPVVGQWSDKSGRKQVLIYCLLMSTIGYALLALGSSVVVLFIARIPAGLFKHSQELSRAYLADVCPPDQHSRVFGQFNSMSNLGFIVGPIIGGHIIDKFGGFTVVATATAFCFLSNLILAVVLLPSAEKPAATSRSQRSSMLTKPVTAVTSEDELRSTPSAAAAAPTRSSWRLIDVWDIMLSRFLLGIAMLTYRHDFVSFVVSRYNSSAVVAGYVSSFASAVGTVVGFTVGAVSNWYDHDSLKLFRHAAFLQTAALVSLVLSPNVILLALGQALLAVSSAVGRVSATDVTSVRGGREHTGALMGTGATVLSVARMLAPTVAGLSQEFDVDYGPLVCSVALATAGSLTLLTMTNSRSVAKQRTS